MTEDYKKTLLEYATGNITESVPTTDEIIKEIIEMNKSKWIYGSILPNGWKDFHYEGLIQEKNTGNIVLYGGYRDRSSTDINNGVYGIITILNGNYEPIKSIFEYDSGTKLRYIQNMKQANDGTFYMVDDTNFAFQYNSTILTSTKRFCLLNNFVSTLDGEYKLTLRSSYIFPSGYNVFKCENLVKNPEEATYVMVGKAYESWAGNYQSVASIKLEIPYGQSPSWNWTNIIKSTNTTSERTGGRYISSFIKFQNDKYSINTLCRYYKRNNSGGQTSSEFHVRIYQKNYNASTYSFMNILSGDDAKNEIDNDLEYQSIFLNENKCYFVLDNLNNNYTTTTYNLKIILWEYNINNSTINKIYEKDYGTGNPNRQEQIYLYTNQGKLYIEHVIKKSTNVADYYYQRYEGVWDPILIGENKPYSWNQRGFYVNNKYNLLEVLLYPNNPRKETWYFPIAKEIYNPTQYNGEPYVSKDALIPLYSNLYSNGSLMFSRDLYNISKQNNMTMASVEIPNSYLNDTTITQNDLISETNLQMNSNNQQWTKNIYEVVDLNFLNTIRVIDEDTGTEYLESAIKLNNAITDGGATNYLNTPCNKYRINYSDETSAVYGLQWTAIDDTHKETTITFYVDKAINSIDLISNDESVDYLNLPVEVEIGNYYSINQKIRIGG
jgi:hypothetical protein